MSEHNLSRITYQHVRIIMEISMAYEFMNPIELYSHTIKLCHVSLHPDVNRADTEITPFHLHRLCLSYLTVSGLRSSPSFATQDSGHFTPHDIFFLFLSCFLLVGKLPVPSSILNLLFRCRHSTSFLVFLLSLINVHSGRSDPPESGSGVLYAHARNHDF
jgi:hypothetical protein